MEVDCTCHEGGPAASQIASVPYAMIFSPLHSIFGAIRSYQATLGLAAAVSTCVGNALGSGNGAAAKRAAAVGIVSAFILQAVIASGVVVLAAKPLVSVSGLIFFHALDRVEGQRSGIYNFC